jgi:hypothetical protein
MKVLGIPAETTVVPNCAVKPGWGMVTIGPPRFDPSISRIVTLSTRIGVGAAMTTANVVTGGKSGLHPVVPTFGP